MAAVTVGELGGSVYADSVHANLERLAQEFTITPLFIDCGGDAETYEDKLMQAGRKLRIS